MIIGEFSWYNFGGAVALFSVGFLIAIITKLIRYFKNRSKLYGHDKIDFTKQSAIDFRLIEILSEIRIAYGPSRALVFRFHNNINYFDGSQIIKMSCSHESTNRGVSHEIDNMRDMLCSMIPKIIEGISMNSQKINYVDDLGDGYCKGMFRGQSVHAFVLHPLYKTIMGNKTIIGAVMLQYLSADDIPKEDGTDVPITEVFDISKYIELIETEIIRG